MSANGLRRLTGWISACKEQPRRGNDELRQAIRAIQLLLYQTVNGSARVKCLFLRFFRRVFERIKGFPSVQTPKSIACRG